MQKMILMTLLSLSGILQGCTGVSPQWVATGTSIAKTKYSIFKNIVYFQNSTPYCTAKVFAGLVDQPVHSKKRFNPVKQSFVLKKGGGEHFIEYNFNTANYFRTKIEWYDAKGHYLNTEYIGHATADDVYHYHVSEQHMGEQRIKLSNQFRKECWRRGGHWH